MSTIKDQTDRTADYLAASPSERANFYLGIFNDNEALPSSQDGRLDASIFEDARTQVADVGNITGSPLAANALVARVGYDASLDVPTVQLADNTTPLYVDGFVVAQIANNAAGEMATVGRMTGLNTSGGSIGDFVYLGTAGAFTLTEPDNDQIIGVIIRSDAVDGQIWFDPSIVYRQNEVRDFQPNHDYPAGYLIAEGGTLYRASVAFTSGATFDSADWETLSGHGPATPESFGAAGTGTGDDTSEVQSAFDTGHVRLISDYRVTAQLNVTVARTIIEGPGRLITDQDGINEPVINVNAGAVDAIIREISIVETSASPTNSQKSGSTNCGIFVAADDVVVEKVKIDGFGFGVLARSGNADSLTIRDVETQNCYAWGIEIDSCRNVNILNSRTHTCGLDGVKIQNEGARTPDGLNVDGLWTYNNGQRDIAAGGSEATNGNGIDLYDGGFRFAIRRLYAYDNYGSGAVIKGVAPQPQMGRGIISDSFCVNNKSTDSSVKHGIWIGESGATSGSHIHIVNTETSGNTGDGISITGGSGITVSGANVLSNGEMGIELQGCFDITIERSNILANLGTFGIEVGASNADTYVRRRIRIRDNNILGNYDPDLAANTDQVDATTEIVTDRGIQVYSDTAGVSITGNTIANCVTFGVVNYGDDVTVEDNDFHNVPQYGLQHNPDAIDIVAKRNRFHSVTFQINYQTGDGTTPSPGDAVTASPSGATGTLLKVTVSAGTWAGGDATGILYVRWDSGLFDTGDTLTLPSATTADVVSFVKPYYMRFHDGAAEVRDNVLTALAERADLEGIYVDTTIGDFRHGGNSQVNLSALLNIETGTVLTSQDLMVDDFDPPRDGNTDHNAVNQAMQVAADGLIGRLVFGRGDYYFTDSALVPQAIGTRPRFEIHGYGTTIRTVGSNVTLFSRAIADMDDYIGVTPTLSNAAFVPAIRGFHLNGQATNSATAGLGIRLDGTVGAVIEDCYFQNLYRGIHLIWGIQAAIRRCNTGGCLQSYLATSGAFEATVTGGTVTNSNCNLLTIEGCRAQVTDSAAIGFRLQGVGQGTIRNSIVEGTDGNICFLLQGHEGSGSNFTTGRDVLLENCWGEGNVATLFKLELEESIVAIRGFRLPPRTGTSPNETVFIDDTTAYSEVVRNTYILDAINVEGWNGTTDPWFVNQSRSDGDKNAWILKNMVTHASTPDLTDASLWANATTGILLKGDAIIRGSAFAEF